MGPAAPIGLVDLNTMPLQPEIVWTLLKTYGPLLRGVIDGREEFRKLVANHEQPADEEVQIHIALFRVPEHPAERVVLTPAVVVPPLAAAHFISHQKHWHSS